MLLVSTVGAKNENPEDIFRVYSMLDMKNVEFNVTTLIEGKCDIKRVEYASKENQISIHTIGGGWCDFFVDDETFSESFYLLERQLEIARALKVNRLRLYFGRLQKKYAYDGQLERAVARVCHIADKNKDLMFVFENHDGISLDVNSLVFLFSNIDCKNVKMNFDYINFDINGVDPRTAHKKLKPYIDHYHLKGRMDNQYCEFGGGNDDLPSFFSEMLPDILQKTVVLEFEGAGDHILKLNKSYDYILKTMREQRGK